MVTLSLLLLMGCSFAQNDDDIRKELERLRRKQIELSLRLLSVELKQAKTDEERYRLLEEGLANEYAEVQIFAMNEIGQLPSEAGMKHASTVKELLARGTQADVKTQAVNLLVKLKINDEAVFLAAAKDAAPEVRASAAGALKSFNTDSAFAALKQLLNDGDRRVKLQAVEAVGSIKRAEAPGIIIAMLAKESDEEVIEKALKALGNLQAADAFDTFVQFLSHRSDSIRWACITGLGNLGDARALPHLRQFLPSDRPAQLRGAAVHALGRLKDLESREALEQIALKDKDEHLRETACAGLGMLGSEQAFDTLVEIYAADGSARVRNAAWEAASQIANNRFDSVNLLVNKLIQKRLKDYADDLFRRLQQLAAQPEQKDQLLKTQEELARLLFEEKMWKLALPHYKTLHGIENNPERSIRLAACYANLGDFESAVKVLKGQMEKLQKTDAAYGQVWLQLVETYVAKKDAVPAMTEAYGLYNDAQMSEPVRAAARERYDRGWETLVASLQGSDEAARARAVESVKGLGKRALPALIVTFQDESRKALQPVLLPLGNSIAGTNFEATALNDHAKVKQIADVWQKVHDGK